MKFVICISIYLISTCTLLQAQPLDWDSTRDVQILKSIASGAYASKIIEKGGLFDFHTGSYDSLFFTKSGDSIIVAKFRVYKDTSVLEKKTIYNKAGTKLYTESFEPIGKTISRYNEKEKIFKEFTNRDLGYHKNKLEADSLFLRKKRIYDFKGNLIGHYEFNRDGSMVYKTDTKYYYFANQSFVIEEDFIHGNNLFKNSSEMSDSYSGSGRPFVPWIL